MDRRSDRAARQACVSEDGPRNPFQPLKANSGKPPSKLWRIKSCVQKGLNIINQRMIRRPPSPRTLSRTGRLELRTASNSWGSTGALCAAFLTP